jgi:hypothetical protein
MEHKTEIEVSQELARFFDIQGWEYRKEWVTKSGKAIDYLVKAPYDGGHIFFGVECKKDLTHTTNATILADYLEQASGYSKDLGMPVFLAPIKTGAAPSAFYHGGRSIDGLAGLTIFGGRFNVGVIVHQTRHYYGEKHEASYLILRGGNFWESRTGFNPKRLHMVCSTGSAKERKEIKVWR